MDNKQFDEIINRFNLLTKLLMLECPAKMSQSNKIKIFSKMNIKNNDIADILGVEPSTIRSRKSQLKNKPSKKTINKMNKNRRIIKK